MDNEMIELLVTDDAGHAIEGPKYPADRGPVFYRSGTARPPLAYPHRFFRYDSKGRPMRDTLVRFLVPDHLCDGPSPSPRACELVAERMGWNTPGRPRTAHDSAHNPDQTA